MTTTVTKTSNQAFAQYERMLIHLAEAMKAGDKESANAIRREMEIPERELDGAMLDRLDGLSADLYMLDGKEYFERHPSEFTPQRLISDLRQSWDNQEWEDVLKQLRQGVLPLSEEHRAYLRAIAYENIGQIRSALVFMDHAARLNPTDFIYKYNALKYLVSLGEDSEAVQRASSYAQETTTPPALLVGSAVAFIQTARYLDPTIQKQQFLAGILILIRALSQEDGWNEVPSEVLALGYVSLGFCLEDLGGITSGYTAYQLALQVDTGNDAARMALSRHLAPPELQIVPLSIGVPKEASKAHLTQSSFQTLKARQILAAAA
jgi:tetratricopeptide (TPR) repeat protein